jgi:hypothetical protein
VARGARTYLRHDKATGLKLFAELRKDPSGRWSPTYGYENFEAFPQHLRPTDVSVRGVADAAFDQMLIYWLGLQSR